MKTELFKRRIDTLKSIQRFLLNEYKVNPSAKLEFKIIRTNSKLLKYNFLLTCLN